MPVPSTPLHPVLPEPFAINVLKLCVVLIGILVEPSSVKAQAGQRIDISPHAELNLARLYADRPFLVTIYVAWMERYTEEALARSVESEPFLSRFQPRDRAVAPPRWTWFASNGNSVRRISAGRFRIHFRNYRANWFSTLDCVEVQWPMFRCEDGVRMTMRAPDAERIVFGDVEYRIGARGYQ